MASVHADCYLAVPHCRKSNMDLLFSLINLSCFGNGCRARPGRLYRAVSGKDGHQAELLSGYQEDTKSSTYMCLNEEGS